MSRSNFNKQVGDYVSDRIKDFVLRNVGRMSVEQMAEALSVSERVIKLYYPDASR